MNIEEINKTLIKTIKSPELEELTTDFSEIAIDQLLGVDGVAKEIPIVASVLKVIKLGFSINSILFLKKLGKFLWHLKDIPYNDRVRLAEKLERDSKYKSDVGSKIMLLLERADDFEKPKIIANAFKAYLYDEITYTQLQRINFSVVHLFIGDIKEFESFYHDSEYDMDECTRQNLELCGLVILIPVAGGGTNVEKVNELGKLFAEKVLLRG
jgi:hypothetical protein